ncbi:MAG: hypothetical protein AABX53_03015 [Nanoarchaeota archaeon]
MHLTRADVNRETPIPRKGTQYIARPLSHMNHAITALSAVRDVLHLAQTAREVKEMIKEKKLKINGRVVRDMREPLLLLSLFEADKRYKVILLSTGRFALEPTKETTRVVKVINKKVLSTKETQINLHDGTNILSSESIKVGDSLEIDLMCKFVRVLPLKEGARVMVNSGRNVGAIGTISRVTKEGFLIKLKDKAVALKQAQVVVI